MVQLVSQISYLGVVLSYTNFELLTVKHRIKTGQNVAHQLTRWLHKQMGLTAIQKQRLWFQCMRFSMSDLRIESCGHQHPYPPDDGQNLSPTLEKNP